MQSIAWSLMMLLLVLAMIPAALTALARRPPDGNAAARARQGDAAATPRSLVNGPADGRDPLVDESDGKRPKGRRLRFAAGELLTCTRCLGTWSSLGLIGLRVARGLLPRSS